MVFCVLNTLLSLMFILNLIPANQDQPRKHPNNKPKLITTTFNLSIYDGYNINNAPPKWSAIIKEERNVVRAPSLKYILIRKRPQA